MYLICRFSVVSEFSICNEWSVFSSESKSLFVQELFKLESSEYAGVDFIQLSSGSTRKGLQSSGCYEGIWWDNCFTCVNWFIKTRMCPDFFLSFHIFYPPPLLVWKGVGRGGGWLFTREQSTAYVQYILKIYHKLLFIIIYIMIWLIYLDIKRETFFE